MSRRRAEEANDDVDEGYEEDKFFRLRADPDSGDPIAIPDPPNWRFRGKIDPCRLRHGAISGPMLLLVGGAYNFSSRSAATIMQLQLPFSTSCEQPS